MISNCLPVSVGASPTRLLSDKCTTLYQVRQIHAYFIKTKLISHALSVAKLVNVLSQSSVPYDAVYVFVHALSGFRDIRGVEFLVPPTLKACGKSWAFEEGKQIMGFILKTHLWNDPFVTNSLVRMCLELGMVELASFCSQSSTKERVTFVQRNVEFRS
ncbi:Pentatricopeptide repeat-containing protein [Vigna angularis]|uniref:Pentatricopeptide repeat-containing protein n=1 Tax=Phaseolus angularis TaxID=3914 RepID=A0A8T0JFK8_PHAAN|nr:Pentatricopeptide repeat-containing protein [Vigna angularis]